jgi:hypothetical protein
LRGLRGFGKGVEKGKELGRGRSVICGPQPHDTSALARRVERQLDSILFSSRSRPAAEILEGFFSSLLPPSFLRGRFATFFCLKAAQASGFLLGDGDPAVRSGACP